MSFRYLTKKVGILLITSFRNFMLFSTRVSASLFLSTGLLRIYLMYGHICCSRLSSRLSFPLPFPYGTDMIRVNSSSKAAFLCILTVASESFARGIFRRAGRCWLKRSG